MSVVARVVLLTAGASLLACGVVGFALMEVGLRVRQAWFQPACPPLLQPQSAIQRDTP